MSAEHIVVMGVSGSGKTTVAMLLAARLGRPFAEADDLHPAANIDKMSAGLALTDADRWPWLRTVRDWLDARAAAGESTVVTCSALRKGYRDVLREAGGRVRFVHLAGDPAVVGGRVAGRTGHFMPPSLLTSQYEALEPLQPGEDGVTVAVEGLPEQIAAAAIDLLHPHPA